MGGPKWTQEELEMVDRLAGYHPAVEIVRRVQAYQKRKGLLVRSDHAIRRKIHEFNKTQRPHLNNITAEELARVFNISGQTVRAWVHRNSLPAKKVGRMYAIDSKDLLKWMRRHPHLVSRIEEDSLRWVIAQADQESSADRIVAEIKAVKPSIDFNRPIAVKSLKTGKKYPSIRVAAKAEFVSCDYISNRIKGVRSANPRVDIDFKAV